MYIKLILLFAVHHLIVISGDDIGVLFNTTIIFDNFTIAWYNFNNETCFPQTTTNFDHTSFTTHFDQTTFTTNFDQTTFTTNFDQTTFTTNFDQTSSFTTNLDQTSFTTMETEQNQISTLSTITGPNYSSSVITITGNTTVQSSVGYTCFDGSFGAYCNISSDVCDITNPCFNEAICHSNNTATLGYSCQCQVGFSGYDCEYDLRICTGDTCWNNGTCIETNTTVFGIIVTSFICQCQYGYEGINCEIETNMCGNITCENKGICVSSYLLWSCQCLDSTLYSGVYCQDKSSALALKEALSKSFAIVAIIAICCLVGFVITMDVLKYVFKIDPVDRERHRLKMEKEKNVQKKFQKKKVKKKKKKKKNKNFITRFSVV